MKIKKKKNLNRSIRSIIPVSFPFVAKLQNSPATMADYYHWPCLPFYFWRLGQWFVAGRSSKAPDLIGRRRSVKIRSLRVLFWEAGASQASFFTRSRGWQSTAITLKGRNANIKPLYWIDWLAIGIIVCVVRPPCAVEMTGAIRNTASSAFYGSCQSQFRIRVSLTLPNDVTKCSISPPLRQNGLANLGWIIAGWNLSISIVLIRVHFQFPRFTLLKATTGQWWMMVVKRWIRWFWIERRDIRVSFFSDIGFFRDKNFHVYLTRFVEFAISKKYNKCNKLFKIYIEIVPPQ